MKGGRVPIHIMRWAPQDYHADEHVKLLKARRDYRTLTFYRHFLDQSFASGGDLPADPEALAAVVEMPRKDVEHALSFCLGRLITQDGERLFQKRVRRDVATELEFREIQSEHGKKGGRPKNERVALGKPKAEVSESETPPSPTPRAFSPAPAPTPETDLPAPPAPAPLPASPSWTREACDEWIAAYHGTAPGGRIGKALKPLVDRHGWSEVRVAWRRYLAQIDAQYGSPQDFAAKYGRWSGDVPDRAGESSADVLRAAVRGGLLGK